MANEEKMNVEETSNLDFNEQIRECYKTAGLTQQEFSEKIGISQQNLVGKINIGKITIEELKRWADVMGAEYVAKMVCPDGVEIYGNSYHEIIKRTCEHLGLTVKYIAEQLNESRQNFSSRIKHGKLTKQGIHQIAEVLGCQYIEYFEFIIHKKI